MPKPSQPSQRPLPTWTIEHASTTPISRREKLALVLFFFVLLMVLSFLIAAIVGYAEMHSVFP